MNFPCAGMDRLRQVNILWLPWRKYISAGVVVLLEPLHG